MVLVEFSFIRQPMDLKDKLFQLQIKGYQPIIAHRNYTCISGPTKKSTMNYTI